MNQDKTPPTIPKDPNSLFECVSVFLKQNFVTKSKDEIRKELIDYIEKNSDKFKDLFTDQDPLDVHIQNVKAGLNNPNPGEESCGGLAEIQAIFYLYGIVVEVVDGDKVDTFPLDNKDPKCKTIRLAKENKHFQLREEKKAEPKEELGSIQTIASKARSLLCEIFSMKEILPQLNINSLLELQSDKIKVIYDTFYQSKIPMPMKDMKKLEEAIGSVYGALSKFYSENKKLKESAFEGLHYQIVFIGDTSAGKDCTLANTVQEDIGYSGEDITTKFPERIIKQKIDVGPTTYKFYKEGEQGQAFTCDSLTKLNEHRIKKHSSYQEVTFDTHVIEILSSDPNVIPVTILNLPGFTNVSPNNLHGEAGRIYKGLEENIIKLGKTGIGSVYIIRKCKGVFANESWVEFFFKSPNIKKEILSNLDFVIVHTHTMEKLSKVDEINNMKTPDDLLSHLQYFEVAKKFTDFGLKAPSQIYVENWDTKNNNYLAARNDPKKLVEFLNDNNEKLVDKIVDIVDKVFEKPKNQNEKDNIRFKGYFGIDVLRKDYLEKISKPTSCQLEGLSYALVTGFATQQSLLKEYYQKVHTYHRSKLGEQLNDLCDKFSAHRTIFTIDTAYVKDVSSNNLNNISKDLTMNAKQEYESMNHLHSYLKEKILRGKDPIYNKWIEIIMGCDRGNDEPYLDLKNSIDRFKQNVFELSKYVPFEEMTEDQYKSKTTNLNYSTKGQSKKDSLNLHVLQELQKKIEEFAPFLAQYITNLTFKRMVANYKLIEPQFADLDPQVLNSFTTTLKYLYEEQLQKTIEHDIKTYSKENFHLIDPSSLTLANELIKSVPPEKQAKLRNLLENIFSKGEGVDDLWEIFKDQNLGYNVLKHFDKKNTTKGDTQSVKKSIEDDFETAKSYMKTAFRIQFKRSIENVWLTIVKNLNDFHIFARDYFTESKWLLKHTLFKLLTVDGIIDLLKSYNDITLQNSLKHSGVLSLKSDYNSLLPPSELEKKMVSKNNLQGLIPYWEDLFIDAKLNSFFEPLTKNIQEFLLEKLNQKKFDKSPMLNNCNLYLSNMKKLSQITIIFENINKIQNLDLNYSENWIDKTTHVIQTKKQIEDEDKQGIVYGVLKDNIKVSKELLDLVKDF